mgnify:FL=1
MTKLDYPTDSQGNRIYEDDTVAFNRSGMVVKGVVRSFKPRKPTVYSRNINSLLWVVFIEADGKLSEVRNTEGILLI